MTSIQDYNQQYLEQNYLTSHRKDVDLKEGIKLGLEKETLSVKFLSRVSGITKDQATQLLDFLDQLIKLDPPITVKTFNEPGGLFDQSSINKKDHQRTFLTMHLYELQRTFNILNDPQNNIKTFDVKDDSGQNWDFANLGLSGRHTKAVKSDAHSRKSPYANNKVYAALADGVSCFSGSPADLFTGKDMANTAIKAIEELKLENPKFEFNTLSKEDFDPKQTVRDFLKKLIKSPERLLEKIDTYIPWDIKDINLKDWYFNKRGFLPSLITAANTRTKSKLHSLYQKDPMKLLESLCDEDFRTRLHGDLLTDEIQAFAQERFSALYRNEPSNTAGSTTLVFAKDLGDQILLFSLGDSAIIPFNKDGLLYDKKPTAIDVSFSSLCAANEEIELPRTSQVTLVDKKDIEGIVMCCDGITNYSEEEMKRAFAKVDFTHDDSQTIARKLLQSSLNKKSGDLSDDKSIVVMKKAA